MGTAIVSGGGGVVACNGGGASWWSVLSPTCMRRMRRAVCVGCGWRGHESSIRLAVAARNQPDWGAGLGCEYR